MKSRIPISSPKKGDLQARLDAITDSDENKFNQNKWTFHDPKGFDIHLEFNDLKNMSEIYPDWSHAKSEDIIILTKKLWISLNSNRSYNTYAALLSGIKLFWHAMAHHNLEQVTKNNCSLALEFILIHTWLMGGSSKLPRIRSYMNFSTTFNLQNFKVALSNLGMQWISQDVTDSSTKKNLKALIPQLTAGELTYRDWFNGGTNDSLTLDNGQYYIEHCIKFFADNYPLAIALKSTMRAVPDIANALGYQESTVSGKLSKLLEGISPEELKRRHSSSSVTTYNNILEELTRHFIPAYKRASFEAEFLKDDFICEFAIACDSHPNPENIDRLRMILWDWSSRGDKPETLKLLSECQKPISWTTFEKQYSSVKRNFEKMSVHIPTYLDYELIGLKKNSTTSPISSYYRQLCQLVSQTGLTAIVALNGWRRSEYGFPYSAILRSVNNDKLDQYAFPLRYQVDWYIQKTHGKVRVLREITFGTLIITERLKALHATGVDQPCLYATTQKAKDPFNSTGPVCRSVCGPWKHFVINYSGFKLLDDWSVWHSLQRKHRTSKPLGKNEKLKLKELEEQRSDVEWTNLKIDVNLKNTWQRVRVELPVVELAILSGSTADRVEWLARYRNGTLRKDWCKIIKESLSDEMAEWLAALEENQLVSKHSGKFVTNSLLEGKIYPKPHAFRHMWAEAVYRRFDFDVGWMIRSQFKHISQKMWLAYIRDKDNRNSHQEVKHQVINSIFQNYINKKGEEYAGQIDVWLRRILKKTSIMTPEEQAQIAEHLATVEIQDIKANPWGYCLLKRRTRNKAKCAEMGEPMRHNASPALCTGCPHNLMKSENIEWTLFHIIPHVEALNNPIVPNIFKASSYELVRSVTKHVVTLNPEHEAIPELQEALKKYKSSRAA